MIYGAQLAVNEWSKANGGRGKKGVICSTASMAAFSTEDGELPTYGTGKAAVVYFTRKLQALIKNKRAGKPLIRVNCVCPAAAATGMVQQALADRTWGSMFNRIVARFSVPVERVADAMLITIEDESFEGEVLRVVPQGIETWDFAKNARKATLAKI